MRICTLASGSSGNSLFVETENTKILVDAGISVKQLNTRLNSLGVCMSEIDLVVITHEHTDHASALPYINKIPVYVASTTVHLWKCKVENLKEFEIGTPFWVNDILITPFPVPHDACDPVGFTVETDHTKIGVVTDIGSVTALVRERLKGSNILVVEFNHDEKMLLYGSYPWDLKQRIKGRLGHLSNGEAAGLLKDLIHNGLRHVFLAHLSQRNNTPDMALRSVYSTLGKDVLEQVKIYVAPRKTLGEVVIG
ncbi:MAG TPA: MBL fold metallo-hydrolase [Thermodesulfobacteriota bacterium]|nr:MBL fold metallo-hydrolase [Thermodesulfobacteriota bacterium]